MVANLTTWVQKAKPDSVAGAFVFAGPTGVGKTAAARALAFELGCDANEAELGGLCEIASGRQDGRAVDDLLRQLRLRPLFGSGWRVAIINEADSMTSQAEAIWLDGLEHLPMRVVVVFTTNRPEKLTDRLTSRCEVCQFDGTSDEFITELHSFVREVWKLETGKQLRVMPADIGRFDLASGEYSIRLALQQIAPYVRSGEKLPARFGVPIIREEVNGVCVNGSAAAKKAWETRRRREVANV